MRLLQTSLRIPLTAALLFCGLAVGNASAQGVSPSDLTTDPVAENIADENAAVAWTHDESFELDSDCRWLNSRLVGDCWSERTGFTVEGWLEQGFTWNPDNPADRFNGHVTQNDRANEYQLNQLYLIASRPADTESSHLSWGFRSDVLYGTDAAFFQALGLADRAVSDSASRFYKLAVPQLYAEFFAPIGDGVTIQVGKWYTPVGYETGLPTEDFFYSKTVGFLPVQYSHTGVNVAFDLSEQISTLHGLHRGSDVWEDNNNALGYAGSFSWTSLDEATNMSLAYNIGAEQDERADWQDLDGAPGPDAPGESLNRLTLSLVLEHQLNDDLQYVFVHDYFYQDGSVNFGIDKAEAYGVTQYLFYDICEHRSVGVRLEVYRDDDGFVAGCRSENPASPGVYTNLTAGMQYRPYDCLMVRPEIRWDWQNRDDPTDTPAFNAGSSTDQFLFSVDAVLQF